MKQPPEDSYMPPTDEPSPEDEIAVEINGLILDPNTNAPILILREQGGSSLLPIWIGLFEANAIAMRMEEKQVPRPMTHDLLLDGLRLLGGEVTKVVVCDLRDSTFFAAIHLQRDGGEERHLDARPSDAIAIALRAEAPLFVSRKVLDQAKLSQPSEDLSEEDRLKKWLEEANPEELGKYTM